MILRNINQDEIAGYVAAKNIDHVPAFAWWVKFTLQKQNIIVSKLQRKYWCTTHKFGIEVPTSVKLAYEIDDEKGNYICRKSIAKEILKVKVSYREKEETP